MRKATIAHIKNNLSRYISYVERGGRVVIFNRERPVAELGPVSPETADAGRLPGHLLALEREGIVRRGVGTVPEELLAPLSVAPGGSTGAIDALLDERESCR